MTLYFHILPSSHISTMVIENPHLTIDTGSTGTITRAENSTQIHVQKNGHHQRHYHRHQQLGVPQYQCQSRSRSASPYRANTHGHSRGHSRNRNPSPKNIEKEHQVSPSALSKKLLELESREMVTSLPPAEKENGDKNNYYSEESPLMPPQDIIRDILGRMDEHVSDKAITSTDIVRVQHTHKLNPGLLKDTTQTLRQQHGRANLHHR
ncbi:hypothetical protein BGZ76_003842 [Entomortierella beljakovae]|nr:hypothetical protein BGZ76_003842 [Entomortierella beljakovae]